MLRIIAGDVIVEKSLLMIVLLYVFPILIVNDDNIIKKLYRQLRITALSLNWYVIVRKFSHGSLGLFMYRDNGKMQQIKPLDTL